MSIYKTLRETVDVCPLIKLYAHGPKAYANLIEQQDIKVKFPLFWVWDVKITDIIPELQNAINPEYNINAWIIDQLEFSASSNDIVTKLIIVNKAARQFEAAYLKHPLVDKVERFNLYEVVHIMDTNASGYLLNFTVKLIENITMYCDVVPLNPNYE